MNSIKNSKLSRVVSTKVTHEEHDLLGLIAKYCQSRGYIAKATTSEIIRFLLKASMEWALSSMNHQKALNQITTQRTVRESRNPVTALGKSIASALEKTSDIGQRQSQDSSISRTDIPSTGNAQQSNDVLGNSNQILTNDAYIGNYNKSLAQKVSAVSNKTRNQMGNTSCCINNVSRPAHSYLT